MVGVINLGSSLDFLGMVSFDTSAQTLTSARKLNGAIKIIIMTTEFCCCSLLWQYKVQLSTATQKTGISAANCVNTLRNLLGHTPDQVQAQNTDKCPRGFF